MKNKLNINKNYNKFNIDKKYKILDKIILIFNLISVILLFAGVMPQKINILILAVSTILTVISDLIPIYANKVKDETVKELDELYKSQIKRTFIFLFILIAIFIIGIFKNYFF